MDQYAVPIQSTNRKLISFDISPKTIFKARWPWIL